jgi:hypothetical protein
MLVIIMGSPGAVSKALGEADPIELRHVHVENGNIKRRATYLIKGDFWIGEGLGLAAEKLDEHPHDEQASPLVDQSCEMRRKL